MPALLRVLLPLVLALAANSLICASSLRVKVHAFGSKPAPPPEILFTRVVADFAKCGSSNNVLAMCASRDFVCRMPDGQAAFAREPSCLPFDPKGQSVNARELEAAAPWSDCDPNHVDVNVPTCRLAFRCMCAAAQSRSSCRCVPPDAVPGRSLTGESCGKAATGGGACASGEYCKWTPAGEQECGAKPYYS